MVSAPTVQFKQTTVLLPTEVVGWIEALADEQRCSRDEMIERAVRAYVGAHNLRLAQDAIAPAAAAAGLRTEDDVETYLDSFGDEAV